MFQSVVGGFMVIVFVTMRAAYKWWVDSFSVGARAMVATVLLVSDSSLVRAGLRESAQADHLSLNILGETSIPFAVDHVSQLSPDIVVMELQTSGIDVFEAIVHQTRVICLIDLNQRERISTIYLIKKGAKGILSIADPDTYLSNALLNAIDGNTMFLSQTIVQVFIVDLKQKEVSEKLSQGFNQLTEREMEVLQLIAEGLTNNKIANQLVVTPSTVRSHVSSILNKLNVQRRTQAAIAFIRRGETHETPKSVTP